MKLRYLAIVFALSLPLFGQGVGGNAASQFTVKPSLPAVCVPRQVIFITQNNTYYNCSATNTWTAFGSATSTPGAAITSLSQIPGLMAEYRLLDGTGTTATDSSGNGNNATLTASHLPTWIATGGLTFAGTQSVDLPAAINTAQTVLIAFNYPAFQITGNHIFSLFNSTNATTPCTGIMLNANATPNQNWNEYSSWDNGVAHNTTLSPVTGTNVLAVTWNGVATDQFYQNGVLLQATGTGVSPVNAGNWELGSGGSGFCVGPQGFVGSVYYAAFYSGILTAGQIVQASTFISTILANRNTPVGWNPPAGDTLILDGDSEMSNLAIPSTTVFLSGTSNVWNVAVPGQTSLQQLQAQPVNAFPMIPATGVGGRPFIIFWAGTNDTPGQEVTTNSNLAKYCVQAHQKAMKCLVATMLSRTGRDSMKNTLDGLINSQWSSYADGELNFAVNVNLGADGASTNTTFFTDGTHTTTASKDNIMDRMIHSQINRLMFGNRDFSTATLYSSGAPAATAITATSEATNTVTVTTTLNPPLGSCAIIAGVTPAGYNNQSNVPCYFVLTTSGTNFTYFNFNSGLGAGTVFGTAAVPLMKEADYYARLGGSATSPSFTLLSCQEFANGDGPTLRNENTTSPWVLTPVSGETINGQASFTMPAATTGHFQTVKLASIQVSTSAGGCNWTTRQP